jgi:hypothetical protein
VVAELWNADRIKRDICAHVQRLFVGLLTNKRRFFPMPNCYELFGVDLVLDAHGKLWFLEANPEPSMDVHHARREDILPPHLSPLDHRLPGFTLVYSLKAQQALSLLKRRNRPAAEPLPVAVDISARFAS